MSVAELASMLTPEEWAALHSIHAGGSHDDHEAVVEIARLGLIFATPEGDTAPTPLGEALITWEDTK